MKQAMMTLLALTVALPLLAEEPEKTTDRSTKKTASTAETSAAQTASEQKASVPPQPVTAQDSPFVAAAKRTNRLGKKPTNLITNETLARSGHNARITTADTPAANLPAPAPPPSPTPEMSAYAKTAEQRKKAEEQEQKARKVAEERQRTLAEKAAAAEEGVYDLEEDDPAALERDHANAASKPDQKPPEH